MAGLADLCCYVPEVHVDEHLLKAIQFSGVFAGIWLFMRLEEFLTRMAKKHLPRGSRIRRIVLINPDED
jgi:hypothetical protein